MGPSVSSSWRTTPLALRLRWDSLEHSARFPISSSSNYFKIVDILGYYDIVTDYFNKGEGLAVAKEKCGKTCTAYLFGSDGSSNFKGMAKAHYYGNGIEIGINRKQNNDIISYSDTVEEMCRMIKFV